MNLLLKSAFAHDCRGDGRGILAASTTAMVLKGQGDQMLMATAAHRHPEAKALKS